MTHCTFHLWYVFFIILIKCWHFDKIYGQPLPDIHLKIKQGKEAYSTLKTSEFMWVSRPYVISVLIEWYQMLQIFCVAHVIGPCMGLGVNLSVKARISLKTPRNRPAYIAKSVWFRFFHDIKVLHHCLSVSPGVRLATVADVKHKLCLVFTHNQFCVYLLWFFDWILLLKGVLNFHID